MNNLTVHCQQSILPQHGVKGFLILNKKDMKNLYAEWVCKDLRSFSILDGPDFRAVAQELIRMGVDDACIS